MEDETDTWVRFSEVGINARMRNALELFAARSKLNPGAAVVFPGSSSPQGQNGRVVAAPETKEVPAALTWEGAGEAAGLALAGEEASGEELRRKA